MMLWLDDMRKAPWGYSLVAKTADECIALLIEHGSAIEHVSLDHDLHDSHYGAGMGDIDRSAFKEKTGYAVLEWMATTGKWTPDISIHTLNPKGAADMLNKLKTHAPPHVKFRRVWPREV